MCYWNGIWAKQMKIDMFWVIKIKYIHILGWFSSGTNVQYVELTLYHPLPCQQSLSICILISIQTYVLYYSVSLPSIWRPSGSFNILKMQYWKEGTFGRWLSIDCQLQAKKGLNDLLISKVHVLSWNGYIYKISKVIDTTMNCGRLLNVDKVPAWKMPSHSTSFGQPNW